MCLRTFETKDGIQITDSDYKLILNLKNVIPVGSENYIFYKLFKFKELSILSCGDEEKAILIRKCLRINKKSTDFVQVYNVKGDKIFENIYVKKDAEYFNRFEFIPEKDTLKINIIKSRARFIETSQYKYPIIGCEIYTIDYSGEVINKKIKKPRNDGRINESILIK